MTFDKLLEIYLDYVNNYITLSVYAEKNGLTMKEAKSLINAAQSVYYRNADMTGEY